MSKYHVEGDVAQRVAARMSKKAQSNPTLTPIDVTVTSQYDGENVDIEGTFSFEGKTISISNSASASARGADTTIDGELVDFDDPKYEQFDELLTDFIIDVIKQGDIDVEDQNYVAVFRGGQLESATPQGSEEHIAKKAQSASAWEDVGDELSSFEDGDDSGYHSSKGGTILRRKFTVSEEPDDSMGDFQLQVGENYITIEARYGYVDAWLNDMERLEPELKLSQELKADSDTSERDQKVAELQANIDKWLSELAEQGTITL